MRAKLLLLALFALLLVGCQASGGEVSSQPEPAPQPKTAQELLEEQLIDDTHDAFLVDTGGQMGTLLVTVELETEDLSSEIYSQAHFSVWNPANMDKPVQTMKTETKVYGWEEILDVNFDGYQDFTYLFAMGVQCELRYCWTWNEEQGQFSEVPEYAEISSPQVDAETQSIYGWNRESAAGDGVSTIHQWVDGELVCMRRIEVYWADWGNYDSSFVLTVEDRINGELTEVFRAEYPLDSGEHFDKRMKWEYDLNYHGEIESN